MKGKVFRISAALMTAVLFMLSRSGAAEQQRIYSFVLLIDQSAAMQTTYHGDSKHRLARKCARDFLKAIPDDISLRGAIYVYGVQAMDKENRVQRIQGMKPFNKARFLQKINDKVKPQAGLSNLGEALAKVRDDLKDGTDTMAVIIISSGSYDPRAVKEARALKEAYKPLLCWHTILIGNSQLGGKFMNEIANTSKKCHIATAYDRLEDPAAMAAFVKRVFMKPGTGDSDMDGVPDAKDRCPGTPYGAEVDINGCWILKNINFDVDSAVVKPEYYNYLDGIAAVLNLNPDIKVEIVGHTDSQGDEAHNQELSERRAIAVKSYLVKAGVDSSRLDAYGLGESQPIADNSTPAGRAMNRRIELRVKR